MTKRLPISSESLKRLLPFALLSISLAVRLFEGVALFELSSDPSALLRKPWSLLSYSLLHQTLLHLIIGVFLLTTVVVLDGISNKAYWLLFLSGSFAGALAFLVLFPLTGLSHGTLVGSSAGICALIPLSLYREFGRSGILGGHPLAWVMVVVAVVDFVSFFLISSPGFLAHVGGYTVGVMAMIKAVMRDKAQARHRRAISYVRSKAETSGIGALSGTEKAILFADH